MSSKPGLLVTGASGFVGRHVIARGRATFDILATGRSTRPDWLPPDVSWLRVDLLDRASVSSLPDDMPMVLHLASETVPSLFSNYDPLIDSVEMTLNLCRHLRSGRFLFTSSCLVYGASANPLAEGDPLKPRGRYGLAKLLCERITLRSQGGEVAVARPFNHIGVGMRSDLVIPSIIRRVRDAEMATVIQMKGADSIRDFLSVDDIVDAYFAILNLPHFHGQTFNVASGKATRISDVVWTAAHILEKPIAGVEFADQGNSADDTPAIVGDANKLREATGWMPSDGLENSLLKLISEDALV